VSAVLTTVVSNIADNLEVASAQVTSVVKVLSGKVLKKRLPLGTHPDYLVRTAEWPLCSIPLSHRSLAWVRVRVRVRAKVRVGLGWQLWSIPLSHRSLDEFGRSFQ